LLEARAALDQHLNHLAPLPPESPSIETPPLRRVATQTLSPRLEFTLWTGAAAAILGFALFAQSPEPPDIALASKTSRAKVAAHPVAPVEKPSQDALSGLAKDAKSELATKLKLAASSATTGDVGNMRPAGWESMAGWPQPTAGEPLSSRQPSPKITRSADAGPAGSEPSAVVVSNALSEPVETGTIKSDDSHLALTRPEARAEPIFSASKTLTHVPAWLVALADQAGSRIDGYFTSVKNDLRQKSDDTSKVERQAARHPTSVPAEEQPVPDAENGARGGAAATPATSGPCELTLAGEPSVNSAAVATLRLRSSCGAVPVVSVDYGEHSFNHRPVDDTLDVDLFAGPDIVRVIDPRGGRIEWSPPASAFRGIAKAVLIWSTPLDLDLKVREFSAPLGTPGFLWAHQRSTLEDAVSNGRGFMSTVDDGESGQSHIEVYTFFENVHSPRGEVAFGVETGANEDATRCASSRDQRYETYLLINGARKWRNRSSIGSVGCQLAQQGDPQKFLRGFLSRLSTPF
jgi:hypothetical protein